MLIFLIRFLLLFLRNSIFTFYFVPQGCQAETSGYRWRDLEGASSHIIAHGYMLLYQGTTNDLWYLYRTIATNARVPFTLARGYLDTYMHRSWDNPSSRHRVF